MIHILIFVFAVTLQAQQPLRTKPSEKLVIGLGFRDWGAITIAGNTVLVGHPSNGGNIYALDASTGRQKWFHVAPKNEGNPSVCEPANPGTLSCSAVENIWLRSRWLPAASAGAVRRLLKTRSQSSPETWFT